MDTQKQESLANINSVVKFQKLSFLRTMDSVAGKTRDGLQQNKELAVDTRSSLESIKTTGEEILKVEEDTDKLKDDHSLWLREQQAKENSPRANRLRLGGFLKDAVAKPLEALKKILLGLLLTNLPFIIKVAKETWNRLRLVAAQVNQIYETIKNIFGNAYGVVKAIIDNVVNFNFFDEQKRLQKATTQFSEDWESDKEQIDALANAWNLDAKDLEAALDRMDEGLEPSEAVQPQDPLVGNRDSTSTPSSTNTNWSGVLNLIGKAESDSSGGYNAVNRGKDYDYVGGHSEKDFGLGNLTDMNIGEVRRLQQQGKIFAAGRYQIIPNTLDGLIKEGDFKLSDKFTPAIQDALAIKLIQNRGVTQDMAQNNPIEAGNRLSMEWAGLPSLSTQQGPKGTVQRGQSYHQGVGPNAATVSPEAFEGALGTVGTAPAQPQRPQTSRPSGTDTNGMSLTNVLTSNDFDTKDYNAPSPIIRTSDRGMRSGRMHQGVDFGTGGQTGWYCGLLLDGVVSYVGYDGGGGKMAFIRSGGIEYVFMHLAKYSPGITQGAKYTSGQPIGEVGNTGRSKGIHLHFEVRKGNQPQANVDSYVNLIVFGKLGKKTSSALNKVDISGTEKDMVAHARSMEFDWDEAFGSGSHTENTNVIVATQPVIATKTNTINRTQVVTKKMPVVINGGGSTRSFNDSQLANLA